MSYLCNLQTDTLQYFIDQGVNSSLKKIKCFCKFSNKHETQDSLNYVNYFRKFSFIICFQILKINNTDKKAETV